MKGKPIPPVHARFGIRPQPEKRTPRGPTSILKRMEKLLDTPCERDKAKRPWRDVLAEAALVNYVKGNPAIIRELHGRWFGPLPESVELTVQNRQKILLRDVPMPGMIQEGGEDDGEG